MFVTKGGLIHFDSIGILALENSVLLGNLLEENSILLGNLLEENSILHVHSLEENSSNPHFSLGVFAGAFQRA